jgi:hypothetical protein
LGALVPIALAAGCKPKVDPQPCITEKRTVLTSIEAFKAQSDRYPTSTDELVHSGFLATMPVYWEVAPAADGSVQPRPGATLPPGCT